MKQETQDKFIEECKKVHNDKYDYSITNYSGSKNDIEYICPKHGVITQNAHSHKSGHGCPRCQMPSLELVLEKELQCAGINYEWQKKFDWLSGMSLDFYINDTHIAIECQGVQHFENKDFFDKRETLTERKERDTRKRRLCKENGIELIYFLEGRFLKYANGENKYFTDIKDLLDYIVSKEDNFDE